MMNTLINYKILRYAVSIVVYEMSCLHIENHVSSKKKLFEVKHTSIKSIENKGKLLKCVLETY